MPVNVKVVGILKSREFLNNPGSQAALDDLLKRNFGNYTDIRKSFEDNVAFWQPIFGADAVTGGDTFFNDNGQPARNNILKQAAASRAILAVRSLGNDPNPIAALEDIVKASTPDDVRLKFKKPSGTLCNKGGDGLALTIDANTNNEDILTNAATKEIQVEAQYQLLEKRIANAIQANPANLKTKLKYLLDSIDNNNAPNFGRGLQDLVSPPPIDPSLLTLMNPSGLGKLIKNQIAIEYFKRDIKSIYDVYDRSGTSVSDALKLTTSSEFNDTLPDICQLQDPTDKEINEFRAILGENYLERDFIPSQNLSLLQNIINAKDIPNLRSAITNGLNNEPYVVQAVSTPDHLNKYRELAARQILIRRVKEINDETILDELVKCEDLASLKRTLEKYPNLKLDNEIRDAFTIDTVKSIRAAAHVQSSLRKNDFNALSTAAKKSGSYAGTFASVFGIKGLTFNETKNLLEPYFSNPQIILATQEEALLKAAQVKFFDPNTPTATLNNIVTLPHHSNTKNEVLTVLGINARDLPPSLSAKLDKQTHVTNNKSDRLLYKLHAYAVIAQEIKTLVALNLSDPTNTYRNYTNYIDKITAINDSHSVNPKIKALSPLRKNEITSYMVETLVKKNPAHKAQEIRKLLTAKTVEEFKTALTTLGIPDTCHSWVNEKTMQGIQEASIQDAITRKLQDLTGVEQAAYPALMKIINGHTGPPPVSGLDHKQKQIVLQEGFLERLVASRDPDEIKAMLHCKKSEADDIVAQFNRIDLIKKINNAALANQLLSTSTPPLVQEHIDEINEFIASNNKFNDPGQYGNHVDILVGDTRLTRPTFGARLSSNEATQLRLALQNSDLATLTTNIGNQYTRNSTFLDDFSTKDGLVGFPNASAQDKSIRAGRKEVKKFLKTIEKGDNLKDNQIRSIFAAFKDATSRSDLFTRIDTLVANVPNLHATTAASLKRELTSSRYNELKSNFNKAVLFHNVQNPGLLNLQYKTLAKDLKPITAGTEAIKDELDRLSKFTDINWLDPVFQATAAQKAHVLLPKYEALAKACDTVIPTLQYELKRIEAELKSLPTLDELEAAFPARGRTSEQKKHIKEVENYRKELEALESQLRTDLKRYQKVQRVLNGDPDSTDKNGNVQRGLLKTLKDAKEGKGRVRFNNYSSTIEDFSADQVKTRLGQAWGNKRDISEKEEIGYIHKPHEVAPGGNGTSLSSTASSDRRAYDRVADLEPGMAREVTINDGNRYQQGSFIEVREKGDMAPKTDKDGHVNEVEARATIHIRKFPEKQTSPTTGEETPESQQARMNFAFAVASHILATRDGPPTPEDPLVLREGMGPEAEEEAKYIWTALMMLGEAYPYNEDDDPVYFDEKSIIVESARFNPKKELGRIYGFSKDSIAETVFKKHGEHLKSLLGGVKTYLTEKHEKSVNDQEKGAKDIKKIDAKLHDNKKDSAFDRLKTRYTAWRHGDTLRGAVDKAEEKLKSSTDPDLQPVRSVSPSR
ncbi:interaptin [Legionella busanensis]|uniref:Interaptin n=1 Tax=Legionella busanensis TaxID=190655 RepID=A0A378JQX3_9GAMM|nr:hypothetical protein [Legionella busanensis]STX52290.1 interaptin [Legionella busanensis]